MATRAQLFSANGIWHSPLGVTAVFMAQTAGGAGNPGSGDHYNDNGALGGGGSAEACMGMMIPVIPDTDYTVAIGVGGIGQTHGVHPTPPGNTIFAGLKTLAAGAYRGNPLGTANSGSGGGVGGSIGFINGGGFDPRGLREGRHYTGGGGGGGGQYATGPVDDPLNGPYFDRCGVHGGFVSVHGAMGPPGSGVAGVTPSSGGPGAGTYWGGNNGSAYNTRTNADPTHYGSGSGGPGEPTTGVFILGGNGAGGCVLLMWSEPNA